MPAFKDLTGQQFGRLTVIRRADDYISPNGHRSIQWLCRCSCGNETVVSVSNLKRNTKSCGCLQRERTSAANYKNMIGQKFGRLTVVKEDGTDKRSMRWWTCVCDCGNTVHARTQDLTQGNTRSCGCYKKDRIHETFAKDISGQRFGKLVAVKCVSKPGDGLMKWLCKCDCGNTSIVTVRNLNSGHTRSCGCMCSYGEWRVSEILRAKHIDFVQQYTFEDLRGPKGGLLSFDFAVMKDDSIACLIEYQGEQHYKVSSSSCFGRLQLDVTDQMKREYCNRHNFKLFEIKYNEDVDDAINRILNDVL